MSALPPNTPRPSTKCRRCEHGYGEHLGTVLHCPDESGRVFLRHAQPIGASQSFSPDEIELLDAIMRGLQRGAAADLHTLVLRRHAIASRVSAKVTAMRRTSLARLAQREGKAS